jgi:hypothetical protein
MNSRTDTVASEDGLRAVAVVQAAYASIASGLPVEVAR